MKPIYMTLALLSHAFCMDTQDNQELANPFTFLYEWTRSDDANIFIEETAIAAEQQIIFRSDDEIFVSDKSFVSFFKNIIKYLDRRAMQTTAQPEDLSLTLHTLKSLQHIWSYLIAEKVQQTQIIISKANSIKDQDRHAQYLTATLKLAQDSTAYLEKWLPKIMEFYQEEIHWAFKLETDLELSSKGLKQIKEVIEAEAMYEKIDDIINGLNECCAQITRKLALLTEDPPRLSDSEEESSSQNQPIELKGKTAPILSRRNVEHPGNRHVIFRSRTMGMLNQNKSVKDI